MEIQINDNIPFHSARLSSFAADGSSQGEELLSVEVMDAKSLHKDCGITNGNKLWEK